MAAPTYPTSGTTAFNLDFTQVVEEVYELCGAESRTGYDLKTARRSLNLMFLGWANRGINMWTVDGPYSINLIQGQATYNIPIDTVDLLDHVIRTQAGSTSNQSDLTISRISEPTYMTIPNKLLQGRPIQVWINRQGGANNTAMAGVNPPTITVWPVPDGTQQWQFVYYRLRRIQEVGADGRNGMDVPWRFLPVLVAGLAYHMSFKIPGALERMMTLKQAYDEAWDAAGTEDREKASIRLIPRHFSIR